MSDIPVEFVLFCLTLLGVALFHHHTLIVGLCGFVAVSAYKITITGFATGTGMSGYGAHLHHESTTLLNLFLLLLGFAILSRHFEKSHVPLLLPKYKGLETL